MADQERSFSYLAFDAAGRRVKGSIAARSDDAAFERLKRDGLAPIRLRVASVSTGTASTPRAMPDKFLEIAFTDSVLAAQQKYFGKSRPVPVAAE